MVSSERPLPTLEELAGWYAHSLGARVWAVESAVLKALLADRHLARVLVVGGPREARELCDSTDCVTLGPRPPEHGDFWASPEELPLLSQTFDLVILIHVLEYSAFPGALLAEMRRVLAPEGLLALVTFNPHSFWALGQRFRKGGKGVPADGRSWSVSVINHGMRQAGLTPLGNHRVCLQPRRESRLTRLQKWIPPFALSHVGVARRRDIGATPLAVRPRFARTLVPDSLPEPTPRNLP